MTTFWNTYANEQGARRAVELLLAAGVPARDVRLLTGSEWHDMRDEPVGGFGAAAEPDAPVGTFANVHRLRCQGTGSFAGDADAQRQGSFADTDRDVAYRYERGRERSHVSGDHGLRRLLRDAGLEDGAMGRVLGELHAGNAVVLAEIADRSPSGVQARLDSAGKVA